MDVATVKKVSETACHLVNAVIALGGSVRRMTVLNVGALRSSDWIIVFAIAERDFAVTCVQAWDEGRQVEFRVSEYSFPAGLVMPESKQTETSEWIQQRLIKLVGDLA